jgi:hypothetical protein
MVNEEYQRLKDESQKIWKSVINKNDEIREFTDCEFIKCQIVRQDTESDTIMGFVDSFNGFLHARSIIQTAISDEKPVVLYMESRFRGGGDELVYFLTTPNNVIVQCRVPPNVIRRLKDARDRLQKEYEELNIEMDKILNPHKYVVRGEEVEDTSFSAIEYGNLEDIIFEPAEDYEATEEEPDDGEDEFELGDEFDIVVPKKEKFE